MRSYSVNAFLQYFLLLPFTLVLNYSFKSNACINSERAQDSEEVGREQVTLTLLPEGIASSPTQKVW